jgi:phage gp46-like protein
MMALGWDMARQSGDALLSASGGLADDAGLGTAVLLSLFLDRRADADDALPDPAAAAAIGPVPARRGWLGDALAPRAGEVPVDRIGSRLWLLSRAKQTTETLRLAEDYAREALAWLLDDGLVTEVTVTAEWVARGLLGLAVQITLAGAGTTTLSYGLRTA